MTEQSTTNQTSLRLWQLISPTLPIGAYAYSQGLEYAVESGTVFDEASTAEWIEGLLLFSLAGLDIPVLTRLYDAWQKNDNESIQQWNQFLLANRESSEIMAEDQHLGAALSKLLTDLGITQAQAWKTGTPSSYANMFALGACQWEIPLTDAAKGYCWAWSENQVAAAIKLIPLGQTAGQRILSNSIQTISDAVNKGLSLNDDDIGIVSQGLAIASALHETQYSRLFRS